jgi:hypothetical protein
MLRPRILHKILSIEVFQLNYETRIKGRLVYRANGVGIIAKMTFSWEVTPYSLLGVH